MQNKTDQETLTVIIQKHLVNFCKILPSFVEKWQNLLVEAEKPLQALSNYSEQFRHVERLVVGVAYLSGAKQKILKKKANIKYIDKFKELQDKLLFKICSEIEEELVLIKGIIEKLNLAIQEIRNKLSLLEKSTFDLDWEEDSALIHGIAFQPPLARILQEGYNFYLYFFNTFKLINEQLKNVDVKNEENIISFQNKFRLDIKNSCVTNYLALVQYVGNEKTVI